MSKPQWIRASQEDYERLADAHSVALREMEQLRAALAAAEAKLADHGRCYSEQTMAAVVRERDSLTVALADERKHSDALNAKGYMAHTTLCNGHNHDAAFILRGLLAFHTARRAAEAR